MNDSMIRQLPLFAVERIISTNVQWKPIKGYEGIYEVSNDGQVRVIVARRRWQPRVLSPGSDRYGYKRISLRINGETKGYAVHRLVAKAFLGNISDGKEVNHKNGNKADNYVDNLEYVTHAENIRHSFLMLNRIKTVARGEKSGMAKLTYENITQIKDLLIQEATHRDIAIMFNISHVAIGHIARGKTWTHHKHLVDGWQAGQQSYSGERNGRSKLTENQVKEIRTRLKIGDSGSSIARQYGVHQSTISLIKSSKNWKTT